VYLLHRSQPWEHLVPEEREVLEVAVLEEVGVVAVQMVGNHT
jgi:hypothetical protein